MTGPDDAELMARFAAGDERAVREIYDRYAGPISTVASAMLGKRDLAEEAVQLTLLKAWRAAGTFDPDREPGPWLYAIARRVAIDLYRRERRPRSSSPLETEPVGEGSVVEALPFDRAWEAWEVRTAVDRLPVEEREVVRLTHLVGMTQREVARHLDIPVGTVKSRSARAHRRLASQLAHLAESDG